MESLRVKSPYNSEVLAELEFADEKQIELVLERADKLYHDQKQWLEPYQRIDFFERLAILFEENRDELINLSVNEGGKPLKDTIIEFDRAIAGIKLGVVAVHDLVGEEIPMGLTKASVGRKAFTFREPIGPVLSISAFNHPINLIIHQTMPAIAAGCPVIIKPALTTPLTCQKIVDLFYQAGLPEDYCQFLICSNELASKLVEDSRVHFLSFIGSAKVGWYLRRQIADGTRCALEHGGAAPVIMDNLDDYTGAISSLVKGAYYHAGQVCVSVQRIFVPENQLTTFTNQFTKKASRLITGDPADSKTDVGPLILEREVERVLTWIDETKNNSEVIGGEKLSNNCITPTIIVNPSQDVLVSKREIFGPVACIYSYKDLDHAINISNSLPYAFQAAVFSKNLDFCTKCVKQLDATAVMLNDHTAFRTDWMPFAGRRESGLGIGSILDTAHDMSQIKMMVLNTDA